jgi:hypothetical protein
MSRGATAPGWQENGNYLEMMLKERSEETVAAQAQNDKRGVSSLRVVPLR